MRAKAVAIAWLLLTLSARGTAGEDLPPMPVLIRAELFAREGADILYAIGNVRLERGDAVITCDAAVLWTTDREAYLEGHVLYRTGRSVLEAERAYVRWTTVKDEKTGREKTAVNRGFLFNAVVRWNERPDRVTWHVRAEEVLQLDVRHFLARGGLVMSPCQFHEPHAFFRASEVELVTDEYLIASDIRYFIRGVSLPPIWVFPSYWPKLYIPLGWQWPEIRFSVGSSGRYGFFAQTEVLYQLTERLFGLLEAKVGVRADYYSKRGFGYGASFEYKSDDPPSEGVLGRDLVRGRLEVYRVPDDRGKDLKEFELGTTDRHRVKITHSQDLPRGWEFDLEYQHHSDAGFRQEYFPSDYEQEKPIENRGYLKYSAGPFAAYLHARWRNQKWLDSTEYLPQIGFNVFSYPLVGNLLYTGHFEFARIRRRLSVLRLKPGQSPADPDYERIRRKWNFFYDGDPDYPILPLESTPQEFLSDGRRLWRFNTYHQLSYPFDAGIFHFEPFAAYRGTYYSDTLDGGSGWRSLVLYGLRVNTQFWRAWEDVRARGPLIDINGVRHVISPEIRFLSVQKPSLTMDKLILTDDTDFQQPPRDAGYAFPARPYRPWDTYGLAFGDIDAIVPVRLIHFSFRNRWQTRREGRVADFLEINPNVTYYLHGDRDNWGKSRGDWSVDTTFSPTHGVYLFLDFGRKVCGTYTGEAEQVGFVRSGATIEISDRWAFTLSQRYEADYANHWAFQLIYQPNNKWRFDVRYEYEAERGYSNELAFRLTRDLHDWIVEFTVQNDSSGLQDLIGVSLQPKGVRELVSGLRYTRDLRGGLDAHQRETYQHYDY
ncbi:MAG TPA: LPS assembly protein LptD [Planctomycetota bacterium]|nr:LPS assembly protein LptD [Planctomycetota bacterium]